MCIRDSDLKSDSSANRAEHWNESDPFWCGNDRKPCNWFCDTADWSQSVCGKFADRCAGHAYCKKGNADDRVLFAGAAFVDVYPGN